MIDKYQYTLEFYNPEHQPGDDLPLTIFIKVLANNKPEAIEKVLLVRPELGPMWVDWKREKAPEG